MNISILPVRKRRLREFESLSKCLQKISPVMACRVNYSVGERIPGGP